MVIREHQRGSKWALQKHRIPKLSWADVAERLEKKMSKVLDYAYYKNKTPKRIFSTRRVMDHTPIKNPRIPENFTN